MPPADVPPPAPSSNAVAGVRLPDRRLIFVEGAPADLPSGATVRVVLDGQDITCTVSIPPALVVWRDPDARCAAFAQIVSPPAASTVRPAAPPEALFLADDTAPDESTMATMLDLARDELGRLGTEWGSAVAPGTALDGADRRPADGDTGR